MSVEQGILIIVIACVALMLAGIISMIYMLQKVSTLTKSTMQVKDEMLLVTARLKPLLTHADEVVQAVNESIGSSVSIVKSSKHITQAVATTLQSVQHMTQHMAQRVEAKVSQEAEEQADSAIQWAELVMQCVKLIQRTRKE